MFKIYRTGRQVTLFEQFTAYGNKIIFVNSTVCIEINNNSVGSVNAVETTYCFIHSRFSCKAHSPSVNRWIFDHKKKKPEETIYVFFLPGFNIVKGYCIIL